MKNVIKVNSHNNLERSLTSSNFLKKRRVSCAYTNALRYYLFYNLLSSVWVYD